MGGCGRLASTNVLEDRGDDIGIFDAGDAGRGTNAARRAMKSSGSRTTWVEPSRNGCLNR